MIIEYSNRNSQTDIISHALINATRNTHHITDHNQQGIMTENLRARFQRALLQPDARDFQFYESTCNVWADHDTGSNDAGHSDNFGCDWNISMILKRRK